MNYEIVSQESQFFFKFSSGKKRKIKMEALKIVGVDEQMPYIICGYVIEILSCKDEETVAVEFVPHILEIKMCHYAEY